METKIKRIGIIGFGNFGTLLASILSKKYDVFVYHYHCSEDEIKKAKIIGIELVSMDFIATCDLVILSVPISKTEETIMQIAPLMKEGSILMDTCSVKVYPCEWLEKYAPKSIQIIGTHPMFGPTTSKFNLEKQEWNLDGLQMVICPLRNDLEKENSCVNVVAKMFEELGLHIIITDAEDHDKQNAKTLSFVHFIGRSLLASGISEQKIYTPGYSDLLKILPHTTSDNWQLFFDMNNYNPYAKGLREKFWDSCLDIEEKVIQNQNIDEMDKNREMIDLIDARMMKLIKKRFDSVRKIATIKREKNMQIVDPDREKLIIEAKKNKFDLDDQFIEDFYKLLFRESYRIQK